MKITLTVQGHDFLYSDVSPKVTQDIFRVQTKDGKKYGGIGAKSPEDAAIFVCKRHKIDITEVTEVLLTLKGFRA